MVDVFFGLTRLFRIHILLAEWLLLNVLELGYRKNYFGRYEGLYLS